MLRKAAVRLYLPACRYRGSAPFFVKGLRDSDEAFGFGSPWKQNHCERSSFRDVEDDTFCMHLDGIKMTSGKQLRIGGCNGAAECGHRETLSFSSNGTDP